MKRQIKKFLSNHQGFTLAELIIVLAILGMLSAIAIPIFSNIVNQAAEKTDNTNVSVVETAIETYRAEQGSLPTLTTNIAKGSAAFTEVVTLLHDSGYLKNATIETQQKDKEFQYDPAQGTVELATK